MSLKQYRTVIYKKYLGDQIYWEPKQEALCSNSFELDDNERKAWDLFQMLLKVSRLELCLLKAFN